MNLSAAGRHLGLSALCSLYSLGTSLCLVVPSKAEMETLSLEEVLAAVEQHYPLLQAAVADREAAAGNLLAAQGGFDTRLTAVGDMRPVGFYENFSTDLGIEQPTRLWGAKFFAGYRVGRGDFPSYEGGRQTDRKGEFGGGVEVPLLRDGPIDGPRARLAQAEIDLARFDPEIELQRIEFRRQARLAYWNWVASGLGVGVAERLLSVAEQRQRQIEGRVERGVLPAVDLADNERLIVDRRIRLRGAEREAEQASIDLSLFHRDGRGEPLIASRGRLPERFPDEDEPIAGELERDLGRAEASHPQLAAIALEIERTEVDLRLARNESLPSLDLRLETSQDIGSSVAGVSSEGSVTGDARSDYEVKALLRFELPIQRREALGRAKAANARLSRLERQQQFARDRISTRIRRARAGLEAAYAQTRQARRNLELARELQRAEERKLMLGTSNLIDVNIRELQAADADRALIGTQAAYFRALADYRAAVALDD